MHLERMCILLLLDKTFYICQLSPIRCNVLFKTSVSSLIFCLDALSIEVSVVVNSPTGCESWTVKKGEHRKTDAFELWCWRRLLRVHWTARRSNQFILKEISPGCSLEGHVEAETPILWPPHAKS